jgi:ATP/maltotriose-dependent transcriptional regulator MalT/DNA-binding SARP family transcriptional activator
MIQDCHEKRRRAVARLSKTVRPELEHYFVRGRVAAALERATAHAVTWVMSPAGSGKTSLVAAHLDACRRPCIWLQVDPEDAEPATFFQSIREATRTRVRRARLPSLLPEYRQALETFSRRYFRELFKALPDDCLLVLDNLEALPDGCASVSLLARAMGETPRGIGWVLVSRREPPAAFAPVRAAGQLAVLDWELLRFTEEETRGLVRQLYGATAARPEWVQSVCAWTEGWAAGVVLALELLRSARTEPARPARAGREAAFEYFAAELFRGLPRERQRFLLETALLPQLTAPEAQKLTGHPEAGAVLEELARHGYFTFRLSGGVFGAGAQVYRYHPLFREFLRHEADRQLDAAAQGRLRVRAAELLADAGRPEEAIALLREAGEWSRLSRLLPACAEALFEQGRYDTVSGWLDGLPDGLAEPERARLLYWKAAARLPFDPTEAKALYAEAFEGFSRAQDLEGTFLSWAGATECVLYGWGTFKEFDRWIDALEALLKTRAPPSLAIEGRVAAMMHAALAFRRPADPSLEEWERRVRRFLLMSRVLDVNRHVLLAINVFHHDLWRGRVGRAKALLSSLEGPLRSRRLEPVPTLSLHVMQALYEHFTGDGKRSLAIAEEGLRFAEQCGVHFWDFLLLAQGAFGAIVSGDLVAARDHVRRMGEVMHRERSLETVLFNDAAAQLALAEHDVALAVEYSLEAVASAERLGALLPEAILRVGASQALFEAGREDEALRELDRAQAMVERVDSTVLLARCHLARAQYLHRQGKAAQARRSLAEGFGLCREHGYFGMPWWRREVMARLCELALAASIETPFVTELVRRQGLRPQTKGAASGAWPWPVKLHTLGGELRVLVDDEPLASGRKSQRRPLELLEALIAMGGRDVSEGRLAEALWPDAEGDSALQAEAITLHRLRKLLGPAAVVRHDQKLSLERAEVWVDCFACEETFDDPQADVDALRQALALYRGPFLDGCEAPWAIPLRERLAVKWVRAVTRCAAGLRDAGRWREAVDVLERAVEMAPTTELLYRDLLGLLVAHGERAHGADVYRRCCEALSRHHGHAPSGELESLAQALGARR